jgi:hypothetical protein
MEGKKKKKGTGLDLIQEIQSRERSKMEIWREMLLVESQIHQQRRFSHSFLLQKIAEKAGLQMEDIQSIWDEIRRRQNVQRRFVTRSHEKIRAKSMDLVKKEAERRKAIRKQYLKLHADKYKARQGNPELKFLHPVGHWSEALEIPDRGLVGWGIHEPDMGEWDYDFDMDVDYDTTRGHFLYPRAYVRTGDIETPMTLTIHQMIVVSHAPLESGRGDFRVDRVRVDLSGTGHSRARMGDTCPFERGHNLWDNTELSLGIQAHQFDNETGMFLEDDILQNRFPIGSGTHDSVVEIELGTSPISHDVLLDNNGSEIWLYVQLTTRVTSADEDGYSEVNFSRDDTDGLMLGCITLIGEYE